jgi:hypothetical protein
MTLVGTTSAGRAALRDHRPAAVRRGRDATRALRPRPARLLVSVRVGPAVFGRGWIEAVDPTPPSSRRRPQAAGGAVSGRANRLADGRIGRLGVKARLADLDAFTAEAFQGDMGLTSPRFPTEVPTPTGSPTTSAPASTSPTRPCADRGLCATSRDARRAGPPPRRARALRAAGCADCHPLRCAPARTSPVAAMAGRDAALYSDLLLHDMGDGPQPTASRARASPRSASGAPRRSWGCASSAASCTTAARDRSRRPCDSTGGDAESRSRRGASRRLVARRPRGAVRLRGVGCDPGRRLAPSIALWGVARRPRRASARGAAGYPRREGLRQARDGRARARRASCSDAAPRPTPTAGARATTRTPCAGCASSWGRMRDAYEHIEAA